MQALIIVIKNDEAYEVNKIYSPPDSGEPEGKKRKVEEDGGGGNAA